MDDGYNMEERPVVVNIIGITTRLKLKRKRGNSPNALPDSASATHNTNFETALAVARMEHIDVILIPLSDGMTFAKGDYFIILDSDILVAQDFVSNIDIINHQNINTFH